MATYEFSATIGARTATAAGSSGQAGDAALIAAADTATGTAQTSVGTVDTDVDASVTAATTADNDVGTVVTNLTTAFTDLDTAGDAIVAITGDTYSHSTHNFTFGGATGLTHAQWATVGALLNTAFTDFKTAQTNNTTSKTATAAAKTAALLAQTDSDQAVSDVAAAKTATAAAVAGGTLTSDVVVYVGNVANVGDMNKFRNALAAITDIAAGSGIFASGSGTPRSPRMNG